MNPKKQSTIIKNIKSNTQKTEVIKKQNGNKNETNIFENFQKMSGVSDRKEKLQDHHSQLMKIYNKIQGNTTQDREILIEELEKNEKITYKTGIKS